MENYYFGKRRIDKMRILVACEESQAVCKAFREKGHESYSCDLMPCSGGHPEWHIRCDVGYLLEDIEKGQYISFYTCDGKRHFFQQWDMVLAFPPCTDLACSGAAWFEEKRKDGRQQKSIEFFLRFTRLNVKKLAIENPVGIMSTCYKKPSQIIQPYQFGDPFEKRTCLWLKGLPNLKPTKVVSAPPRKVFESGATMPEWYANCWKLSPEERRKQRSKTFPGIALAMSEQWG